MKFLLYIQSKKSQDQQGIAIMVPNNTKPSSMSRKNEGSSKVKTEIVWINMREITTLETQRRKE